MSTTQNTTTSDIELVRRVFDAFYAADGPALRKLLDADFVAHTPGGGTESATGWISMAKDFAASLQDNEVTIEDIFGTDGRVAVRYASEGVHTGDLFGVAPTNRPLRLAGIELYRIENGRICEVWGQYDMTALFNSP